MALKKTPEPAIGSPAPHFDLLGVDGQRYDLDSVRGENGTLIMFICNHCPYVKAIQDRLSTDCLALKDMGVACAAIMSNDPLEYPEDSYENMQRTAITYSYPFPYLWDRTQEVARAYGAVCTPDFFGYDRDLKLQYRGRLDAGGRDAGRLDLRRDLVEAFRQIVETGQGPEQQYPSMGCSIKWRDSE